jgi:drug/metabolite transporter (DMT)-like permease
VLKRTNGVPEIILCTLTWGTISPIVRTLESPARVIVAFRLGVGALTILLIAVLTGRLRSLRPHSRPVLLIGSGLTLAVHWGMLFVAYKRLEPSAAVGLVFIAPVIAASLAPVLLREKPRLKAFLALAVALVGVGTITIPGFGALDGLGVAAALGAAATFAALILMGKLLTEHYPPFVLTSWQLGVAAIPAVLGLAGGTQGVSSDWPILVMLGAIHTGIAGLLFFRALGMLEAQTIGTLFYLEPASAVVYAWIFLGSAPTLAIAAGFALIVGAGLAIIFWRENPPPTTLPGAA